MEDARTSMFCQRQQLFPQELNSARRLTLQQLILRKLERLGPFLQDTIPLP